LIRDTSRGLFTNKCTVNCFRGRRHDREDDINIPDVSSAKALTASDGSMPLTRQAGPLGSSFGIGEDVNLSAPTNPTNCFVHESAYVDAGAEIGPGTRIWYFTHVFATAKIGRDCVLGQNVMIGPGVTIGDRCKIQNNVSIYPGVTLEDGVFCGPSCVFTNVTNPRADIERKDEFRPTLVGRGATIGANATIVCGHHIGPYSFIAAGAVVTRDVPAHSLIAGNPGRRIGWMSRAGYRLDESLICAFTGERYAPDGSGGLTKAEKIAAMPGRHDHAE
jgi:acetyltransferase-like isoleucine patch superfamily enzyme